MVACYCRVSSRRQSPDSQKAEIQRWLRQIASGPAARCGSKIQRPATPSDGLRSSVTAPCIFTGNVEMVVVWKLDRLSRRQHDGVNLLAEWCERGVRIVVVTQQIDFSGTVGRLVASVLFGLAEIEQEYRHERQAAGIAVAKRHGVYRGRSKARPRRNLLGHALFGHAD